jgi:hypothetical protein
VPGAKRPQGTRRLARQERIRTRRARRSPCAQSVGAAGAYALPGAEPTDARTFAIVLATMFAVAFIATLLPARHATAVDPAQVLRGD